MKKRFLRKLLFWAVVVVLIAPFLLRAFVFGVYALNGLARAGYDRHTADCYRALRAGESEKALRLAKIGYSRFIRMRESRRSFYNDYATQLPRAYELAGDYDAALKYYGLVEDGYCRNLFRPILIFRARIAYKKGEFEESFRNYCSYFQDFPRQERGVAYTDAEGKDNYLREHLSIRRVITGEKSPDVKRLSPFTEFSNFASFMEGEFEKLGRPKEFEEAMVEVRSIDLNRDKIDEIEQAEWERWGDGRNPTILEEREILRKERDQAKAPSA